MHPFAVILYSYALRCGLNRTAGQTEELTDMKMVIELIK